MSNLFYSQIGRPIESELCDLCIEIRGSPNCKFRSIYKDITSRIIFETDDFVVIPTIGQIVKGYLLVLPKNHSKRIAEMSSGEIESLSRIADGLRSIVRNIYCDPIFFEHGAAAHHSSCGTIHTHLHVVPFPKPQELFQRVSDRYAGKTISSLYELKSTTSPKEDYLLLAIKDRLDVFRAQGFESQYIRRIMGQILGISPWDWKKCKRESSLLDTLRKLTPLCKELNSV